MLISINRFYSFSVENIYDLREKLLRGTASLEIHIRKLYKITREYLLLEKRKNRISTEEIILLFINN
jgi:hypothetical protein